jgi:hypothetical protein
MRGRETTMLPNHQQREATLDTLLGEGITPAFERMARTADRVALRIDASRVRAIARQQSEQEWWQAFCTELYAQYQEAQLIAGPVCLVAKYFAPLVPSCAALEGGAMVLLLAYLYECQLFY